MATKSTNSRPKTSGKLSETPKPGVKTPGASDLRFFVKKPHTRAKYAYGIACYFVDAKTRKRIYVPWLFMVMIILSSNFFEEGGMAEQPSTPKVDWDTRALLPTNAWRQCASDRECTIVQVNCFSCCDGYDAINNKFEDTFNKKLAEYCLTGSKQKKRLACDCVSDDGKALCKEHLCKYETGPKKPPTKEEICESDCNQRDQRGDASGDFHCIEKCRQLPP
jgi:hypothetical protein